MIFFGTQLLFILRQLRIIISVDCVKSSVKHVTKSISNKMTRFFFYFSFMKQKKLNASAVNNTLPVIPDAPPPGAALVPPAGVVDEQNPAISEI